MPAHIAQLISEKIAEERAKDTRKRDFTHVTDLTKCPRGVYLKRLNNVDGFDDRQLRIFKCGKIFEDFVISSIPNDRIAELQGELIWPELNLMGTFDLLTNEDGGYHLYELKSQNSQSFHYMLDAANPAHVEQVMLYASKLRERLDLKGISICYLSKDDLCVKQFDIEYDQGIVDGALKKASYLKHCWNTKTLPLVQETLVKSTKKKTLGKWEVNWMAKYCDLHHLCMGNENWQKDAEKEADDRNQMLA